MTEFDPAGFPRKLNLGCGWDLRAGYLNVDLNAFHKPDLVGDVRDLPMLPSGHYQEIIAQDVLEHLPRTATASALREWNRLLQMGGTLVLRVPSLEGLAELFRNSRSFNKQRELMQCLFGTQAYTGDFHLTSFTRLLLEGYLTRTGFKPQRVDVMHDWLFDATARKVAEAGPSLDSQRAQLLKIADDGDFVFEAYELLLRRKPDDGGQAFYLGSLKQRQLTREQVLGIIEGSPEFRDLHAESGDA
jgi:SAM-dependent methyltransferase